MRVRTVTTTAIAASLTLVAGLIAVSADARTERELKACWQAPTGATLPLTIKISGRQHGERALANGTCKAWDVPSGTYTYTAKAQAIRTIFNASPQGRATVCGKSSFHNFRVVAAVTQRGTTRIVRLGESGGSFSVQVRSGHLTKANFRLQCLS